MLYDTKVPVAGDQEDSAGISNLDDGRICLHPSVTEEKLLSLGFHKGRDYYNYGDLSIHIKGSRQVFINIPKSSWGGKMTIDPTIVRLAQMKMLIIKE